VRKESRRDSPKVGRSPPRKVRNCEPSSPRRTCDRSNDRLLWSPSEGRPDDRRNDSLLRPSLKDCEGARLKDLDDPSPRLKDRDEPSPPRNDRDDPSPRLKDRDDPSPRLKDRDEPSLPRKDDRPSPPPRPRPPPSSPRPRSPRWASALPPASKNTNATATTERGIHFVNIIFMPPPGAPKPPIASHRATPIFVRTAMNSLGDRKYKGEFGQSAT
jgi:hypothetical protein